MPLGMVENKYIRVLSAMPSQLLLLKISNTSHRTVARKDYMVGSRGGLGSALRKEVKVIMIMPILQGSEAERHSRKESVQQSAWPSAGMQRRAAHLNNNDRSLKLR